MLGLLFFFVSCDNKNTFFDLNGYTMGTSYSIKFGAPSNELNIDLIGKGIDSILISVNQEMSTWDPKSTISKFNNWHSTEPFEVSSLVIDVMVAALDVSKKTEGKFDVTVYDLMSLWGFGPNPATGLPKKNELEKVLSIVGYEKIKIIDRFLVKKNERIKIDLNSIAKGQCVDLIFSYLKLKGIQNLFVEIGGEVRFSGKNKNNQDWVIGIEDVPSETSRVKTILGVLSLDNGAVATSGNYRNIVDIDGNIIGHTINPKTGYPVQTNLLSVTVISNSCMRADAWATALMTMTYREGKRLVENEENLKAVWLIKLEDDSKRIAVEGDLHLKNQRYSFFKN